MIVTIHQPAYLPWLGYFHKINLADKFIFFDTTQFEKNSFINRNKIKTANGPIWLTVPVKLKDHTRKEIRQINLADQNWRKKHWQAIEMNYKKSKYWSKYSEELKKIYEKEYANIADLCYDQLIIFLNWLNIKTEIVRSSELKNLQSKKLDLVLDLLKDVGASVYISGALGRDYIDGQKFRNADIKLYYQNYEHPTYGQQRGVEFVKYMSIIDLLFNQGEKSLDIIMQNNIVKNDLLTKMELYE